MQPDQRPPDGGKLSFLYGLIFGVGMFLLGVIFYCINTFLLASSPVLNIFITGLAWLIDLGLFFLVGTLVARKTGRVGTATIAAIWTAVFDGVLYAIFTTIMIFTVTLNRVSAVQSSSSTMSPEATRSLMAVGGIFGVVVLLLLTIGFGAGMGALGGLLGRSLARKSGNPYLGAPFPYGQPLYPGQPPYPGQPHPGQPFYGQPYPGQPPQGPFQPGQPGYGQPNPGQPYPGQPPQTPFQPGQSGYGQPNPGQPNLGQSGYGQPNPGQPNLGQSGYGQPNPGRPNPGQPAYEQPQSDQTQLAPPSYRQSQEEQTRLAPPSYRQSMAERPAEAYREQPAAEDEDKTVYASGSQAGSTPVTNDGYPASDTGNRSSSGEQLPYRPN